MIAFASNSLLCRLALKQTNIDAASFTFVRIVSGAVALWFILQVRRRLRVNGTAAPLVERSPNEIRFPSPPAYAVLRRGGQSDRRGGPFSLREKVGMRAAGNWASAFALFAYAAAFSFAYVDLPAGTG